MLLQKTIDRIGFETIDINKWFRANYDGTVETQVVMKCTITMQYSRRFLTAGSSCD